jgi:hypothetical protein
VLAALEAMRVTIDQLRYWHEQQVIPVAKVRGARGALLCDLTDVALARIVVRLLQAQVVPQHVTSAFRYLRLVITTGLRSTGPMALVFDDRGTASVVSLVDAPADAPAIVSLRECKRGVEQAARALRRSSDGVWVGWRTIPTRDVEAALA